MSQKSRRPTHPGAFLREEILPPLGLSQGDLARLLYVSRRTVSEIVTERRSVSIDVAHRLARLFNMDSAVWIQMQQAVDEWDVLQAHQKEYAKIRAVAQVG
jgi:addiction module HigA family antidote